MFTSVCASRMGSSALSSSPDQAAALGRAACQGGKKSQFASLASRMSRRSVSFLGFFGAKKRPAVFTAAGLKVMRFRACRSMMNWA